MNKNKLRLEEYTPAADFLLVSFMRDREELSGRFSEFTTEYLDDFKAQLDKVKTLEQTLKLTEEQKGVTQALYVMANAVNAELNFLTFYFKRAGLEVSAVTKLKMDLQNRNIEGACLKMAGLIQFIIENNAVLESKGMAATFPAQLQSQKAALEAKNTEQNAIMNTKDHLYAVNGSEYKALYTFLSTVASAGKIMYDGQAKEDEYIIARLIGRMRAVKDNVLINTVINK